MIIMITRIVQKLQIFFHFDIITHLSIIIGIFTLFVLGVSFFTFFSYLYQPLFIPSEAVFVINPMLDYNILQEASKEIRSREASLEKFLSQTYFDPFQ